MLVKVSKRKFPSVRKYIHVLFQSILLNFNPSSVNFINHSCVIGVVYHFMRFNSEINLAAQFPYWRDDFKKISLESMRCLHEKSGCNQNDLRQFEMHPITMLHLQHHCATVLAASE